MTVKSMGIEKELLESLYWGNQLSSREIGKRFNCSKRSILENMVGCGIPRRGIASAMKGKHNSPGTEFKKEYIPWNKGIPHSKETRRRMSKTHKLNPNSGVFKCGIQNPNWKGGTTSRMKILQKSNEWKVWRELIFERDDYTCQKCGKIGGKLHPHHIKPKSKYPELIFDINNGTTLCEGCHINLHSGNQGVEVKCV